MIYFKTQIKTKNPGISVISLRTILRSISINKWFIIIFLFSSFPDVKAQLDLKEPIPPTPNAAAFGKYSDIPVSLHTGVPNISIPIYTIQEGPLSLPISLSYHSSGIS